MRYGLSEKGIKSIINQELNKNPDLKYYINNAYIEELIQLLIDGISRAIVENSDKVFEDIKIDKKSRGYR